MLIKRETAKSVKEPMHFGVRQLLYQSWGTWVAQSVKRPTLAQVMISRFVSSSPTWGSVLTAQSLEPASDSVFPSLCALPLLMLSLSKINKS